MANFKYSDYISKYQDKITNLSKQRDYIQKNYYHNSDVDFIAAADDLAKRQKYDTESARARMNALVGGTGSGSATATAMAQVNNDYIMRINQLIPIYKQKALDNIDNQIATYMKADEDNYDKYKTERDFAYTKYLNNRDFKYKKNQDKKQLDYQKQKDAADISYKAQKISGKLSVGNKVSSKKVADNAETIKKAMAYSKIIWQKDTEASIKQTFNYIKSLGISNKDKLYLVSKLGNKGGVKALQWYSKLGYNK